jgi:hypothetical protein
MNEIFETRMWFLLNYLEYVLFETSGIKLEFTNIV